MPFDIYNTPIVRIAGRLLSYIGIGLVQIDDEDYNELISKYKAITRAHCAGSYTDLRMVNRRDYHVQRMDGIKHSPLETKHQLEKQFATQVSSTYLEDPAHIVMRANRAKIASRVYASTIYRKGDTLVEVKERSEQMTTWVKTREGWKRIKTSIHFYEQNTEVLGPAASPLLVKKKSISLM